jgi:hypothetical protein
MNPLITNPSAPALGPDRVERSSRLDAATIRRVKALGLLSGWRCATVGARAGSIAVWLAERVGRLGRVVAVEAREGALDSLRREGLEVRRHDVVAAPLEPEYDFVHTRLSALYLMERDRSLRHMVASLRPGGWLLVEEYDLGPSAGFARPETEVQEAVNDAFARLLGRSSALARDGMPLAAALISGGLQDVQGQARTTMVSLGVAPGEALVFQLEEMRERLVAARLLTDEQIDQAVEEARTYEQAGHEASSMAAAWGRKPVRGV